MSLVTRGLAIAAAMALAPIAAADLTTYTQDWESANATDGSAISADGWIVFANVFDDQGVLAYNYGVFPAPNMTGGFSNIATGFGGPAQGTQHLDIISDYLNADHTNNPTWFMECNVFRQETIDASQIGEVFTFSWDERANPVPVNGNGTTTTAGFIKVFDPSFNIVALNTVDTTLASTTSWGANQIQVTIDQGWEGFVVQYGFLSNCGNNEDSSRFYDNLEFSSPNSQAPGIENFSQDFEAMDINSPTALEEDGWLVFANVFDQMGAWVYGYGAVAPNGTGGFSNVASGAAGPNQGAQYVAAFADYLNQDQDPAVNGYTINSLLFQEQTVGQSDVGRTLSFSFDYLKDGTVTNGDGGATTQAFIKVLQQSNGSFAELISDRLDTTNASTTQWASHTLEIVIDQSLVGELLQFGFESSVTNFEDSGRFYDNVVFGDAPVLGDIYCNSNPNSTGVNGTMALDGSATAADNNMTLMASSMPNNQFGIFVVSATQGVIPLSNGILCVSGAIGRYQGPGQIQVTGTNGAFDLAIDLTAVPQGAGFVPTNAGQTWNFQAWFRDVGGSGSNFTDAISITFQ